MSLFFKSPIDLEIRLDKEDSRKHVEIKNAEGKKDSFPIYEDGETVSGTVTVRVRDGKKVEHSGIRAQLFGSIETSPNAGGAKQQDFLCLSHDLALASELTHSETYKFSFKDVEKKYESYRGKNVNVNYYIKIVVMRKSTDITKVKKFWCYLYNNPTDIKKSIKLDIGIDNCLHIEFEYSKSTYSLKDILVGRIYFLLTRLKIKHMELCIITRETVGGGASGAGSSGSSTNQLTDSSTIRYEIMDGSPVKGETIPIRLFLGGYDLSPSIKTTTFNVKNYLSLIIIDEDGRRYFKQSEINLFRSR